MRIYHLKTIALLAALAGWCLVVSPAKAELGFVCKTSDERYGNCSSCNAVYPRGTALTADYFLCPSATASALCCPAKNKTNSHRSPAYDANAPLLGGLGQEAEAPEQFFFYLRRTGSDLLTRH